jgi:transcriptional regulator with XRE-family HTH domain
MKDKHSNLVKLGAEIRGLRQRNGFSQEFLASEAGLDRSYLGGIERGERNASAINLIRIAKALKIEVGDLFPSINILV